MHLHKAKPLPVPLFWGVGGGFLLCPPLPTSINDAAITFLVSIRLFQASQHDVSVCFPSCSALCGNIGYPRYRKKSECYGRAEGGGRRQAWREPHRACGEDGAVGACVDDPVGCDVGVSGGASSAECWVAVGGLLVLGWRYRTPRGYVRAYGGAWCRDDGGHGGAAGVRDPCGAHTGVACICGSDGRAACGRRACGFRVYRGCDAAG